MHQRTQHTEFKKRKATERMREYIWKSFIRGWASRWLSGKESGCQCRRLEFDIWVGKSSWRRKWQLASVILAWRILWTEEPGELLSIGLQRVGHDLASKQQYEELIFRMYRNNGRIYKELRIQQQKTNVTIKNVQRSWIDMISKVYTGGQQTWRDAQRY